MKKNYTFLISSCIFGLCSVLKLTFSESIVDVRLLNGTNVLQRPASEGRLELQLEDGRWSRICSALMTASNNEKLACHKLGYSKGTTYFSEQRYGTSNSRAFITGLVCADKTDISQCVIMDDILKDNSKSKCVSGQKEVILKCYNTSDITDVKLERSNDETSGVIEGRLTVYIPEFGWGTVKISNWKEQNTKIVCKELGYPKGISISTLKINYPEHPSMIKDVKCRSSASSLKECQYELSYAWSTGSADDVALRCYKTASQPHNPTTTDSSFAWLNESSTSNSISRNTFLLSTTAEETLKGITTTSTSVMPKAISISTEYQATNLSESSTLAINSSSIIQAKTTETTTTIRVVSYNPGSSRLIESIPDFVLYILLGLLAFVSITLCIVVGVCCKLIKGRKRQQQSLPTFAHDLTSKYNSGIRTREDAFYDASDVTHFDTIDLSYSSSPVKRDFSTKSASNHEYTPIGESIKHDYDVLEQAYETPLSVKRKKFKETPYQSFERPPPRVPRLNTFGQRSVEKNEPEYAPVAEGQYTPPATSNNGQPAYNAKHEYVEVI